MRMLDGEHVALHSARDTAPSSGVGISLPQHGFFVSPKILAMTIEQVWNDRSKVGTRWDIDCDQLIRLEQLSSTAQAFTRLSKQGRIATRRPNYPNTGVRSGMYRSRVVPLASDIRAQGLRITNVLLFLLPRATNSAQVYQKSNKLCDTRWSHQRAHFTRSATCKVFHDIV
jgi:hypothetical protein